MTQQPDIAMAQSFLDLLEPGGEFIFQTFDDSPAKRKLLTRVLSGPLSEHAALLAHLNSLGAGVFAMVNRGSARNNEAVTAVRSYFVDLDGAPIEPVIEAALPPDLIVATSPKKFHAYWLTDGCPPGEYKTRQRALAQRFHGDPAVCDLARVMRLPGFFHCKTAEPFLVTLMNLNAAGNQQLNITGN
jgi:hypothetical protein